MTYVSALIHTYGLWVVAACIGLESLGLPLPGETALIVAAAIAGHSHSVSLNIFAVILTATAASIVGRTIGYFIGRKFGYWFLVRYGSYLRVNAARIKLGQYLFLRHGGKIIIVAQFLPVLRTIAGILAGANRMPNRRFLLANVVGAFLWAVFFGFAAYYLGREFERLEGSMVIVLGIAAVIVIYFVVTFLRGHEMQLEAEAEKALPGPLESP
jgi:membrane protein DedA with SNARE-associated domain